jgi:hypothetical protein
MAFERCTTKRRNRLNGIANQPHIHGGKRWELHTHIASATVAGYLVLSTTGKEGLEMP